MTFTTVHFLAFFNFSFNQRVTHTSPGCFQKFKSVINTDTVGHLNFQVIFFGFSMTLGIWANNGKMSKVFNEIMIVKRQHHLDFGMYMFVFKKSICWLSNPMVFTRFRQWDDINWMLEPHDFCLFVCLLWVYRLQWTISSLLWRRPLELSAERQSAVVESLNWEK